MKNLFKIYLVIWFVIALIFNVVAFMMYGAVGEFYKYDLGFIIRLITTDFTFVLQLLFSNYIINNIPTNQKDDFAALSATAKNAGFLVLQMLVCVIIALFPVIPAVLIPISSAVILIANILTVTLTSKLLKNFAISIKCFFNKKVIKFVVVPVFVFLLAAAIIIPTLIYPSIKYNNALKYIDDGDISAACSELSKINGYKDSAAKLADLVKKDEALAIYTAKIGDTVTFGKYEQDANNDNGYEPLKWTVIDKKGNKLFLISSYCIEKIPYHNTLTDITWAECSLREWLNSKFIELAFNDYEKSKIAKTYLSNNKNPTYIAPKAGKNTTDKVFVLSYFEAKHYLSTDSLINVKATATVKALNAHVNSETGYAWWWLRSPGSANTSAMTNHFQKQFSAIGYQVNHEAYTVRPCMWIEL